MTSCHDLVLNRPHEVIGTLLLWYNLEILPDPPYFNYCIICPFKIDNLMVGDWVLLIHSK